MAEQTQPDESVVSTELEDWSELEIVKRPGFADVRWVSLVLRVVLIVAVGIAVGFAIVYVQNSGAVQELAKESTIPGPDNGPNSIAARRRHFAKPAADVQQAGNVGESSTKVIGPSGTKKAGSP